MNPHLPWRSILKSGAEPGVLTGVLSLTVTVPAFAFAQPARHAANAARTHAVATTFAMHSSSHRERAVPDTLRTITNLLSAAVNGCSAAEPRAMATSCSRCRG